ncbi:MAG: hypothetical protein RLZZ26_229 [Candidatus Parcubacteria bacterium]|jgi:hypothetical protein
MSIISDFPTSYSDDSSYPRDAYFALNETLRWLKEGVSGWGPDNLFRICKEMAAETPYMPMWKTSDPRPYLGPDGEFGYRRPVWSALAAEIDKANAGGPSLSTLKAKADWLANQLQVCHTLRKYERIVADFEDSLGKINISVHFKTNDWSEPDVVLTGAFKPRAEAVVKNVSRIVEAVLPVLEEMIKKKKSA